MIDDQTVARQKADSQMVRDDQVSVRVPAVRRRRGSTTIIRRACSDRRCVLYLDGALGTPVDGELRHNVRALLRRGEHFIVLDLTLVPTIDAAGVSELVRAHNMVAAAQGVLQIVHATPWVRQILEHVGLFGILTEG